MYTCQISYKSIQLFPNDALIKKLTDKNIEPINTENKVNPNNGIKNIE